MGRKDPRVDAYIARSADFAKPILNHLRSIVHAGCPDVVETLKWGVPSFEYHGILGGMASFKEHCMFGFWNASVLDGRLRAARFGAQGARRLHVTSLADLPAERTLVKMVKQAAKLNETGVSPLPRKRKTAPRPVEVPQYFIDALRREKKALAAFQAFPPSHKREYVEWVTEAKREETRQRRLETAVAWIAKGKSRNWKYERS
jgi:uncharacterized protein YdeI (YjbR/CyaY-like superfamily)